MFSKEPTEVTPFSIDWSDWLGTLTISTSTWGVPSGITKDSDDKTSTTTQIVVSGGTWGETYELENTIIASDGSVEVRTILIRIQRSVAYCSSLEVRRRTAGGLTESATATDFSLSAQELDALIEQASRVFDSQCGLPEGWFNPVAIPIPTEKVIYGNGTNYLRLPPYIPGSLNTTLTMPEGYTVPSFTEQNGYLVINSNGILPPFAHFHNSIWNGWYAGVPVTVSAIWGYRETPPDVKAGIIEFVINLWRETDPAELKLINLDNQPLREKMPPRTQMIASKYQSRSGVLV